MWNNISLKPPPTNSYQGSRTSVDTDNLRISLNRLINVIKHYNEPIFIEKSVLCEILYKYKVRLMKNVEIRCMLKIKKFLERHETIDLEKDITHFLSLVPNNQKSPNFFYFPTRQMFQYILVRLQGYTKLFDKLIYLTKNCAKYMINKMTLGHYWTFALCTLSTVSRIWEISHHIIHECCVCYKKIIPVHNQLDLFGAKWLTEDYDFPKDLRAWLGITRTIDELRSLPYRPLDAVTYIISDDEDDDIQFMGSYKNDYIIIDDSLPLNDDVEFVNEYIDLLNTPKNTKRTFTFDDKVPSPSSSVIEIDTYNGVPNTNHEQIDDVEIIEVDSMLKTLDNDIGEIVDRNDEHVPFYSSDESSNLVTSTPLIQNEPAIKKKRKKKKKRPTSEESEVSSAKKLRQDNTHVTIRDDESVIFLSDSSVISQKEKQIHPISAEKKLSQVPLFKTPNTTVINLDSTIDTDTTSQKSVMETSTQDSDLSESDFNNSNLNVTKIDLNNLKNHNLNDIKDVRTLKSFLMTEKQLRAKNHENCLTKNISKKTWTKIVKEIEKVFVLRKRTKQNKKVAVNSAKNILKRHL